MGWISGFSLGDTTSYVAGNQNVTLRLGQYKNDTGTTKIITEIKAAFGTGNAEYNDPDYVHGSGAPYNISIKSSTGATSSTVNVATKIGAHGSPPVPVRNQCTIYTFTFSPGISVANNATVTFTVSASSVPSGICMVVTNRRVGDGRPTSWDGTSTRNEFDGTVTDAGYTLTWDANGGYFDDNSQKKTNTGVPSGADPTKYIPASTPGIGIGGIVFSHWSKTTNGAAITSADKVTGNTTYYAVYKNVSSVNFNYDGGTDSTGGSSLLIDDVEFGTVVPYPYTVSKSGYDFVGWKQMWDDVIVPDMNVKVDTSSGRSRYNLTAQWKLKDLGQIIYEMDGGSPTPPSQVITSDPASYTISTIEAKKQITITLNPQGGTVSPNKITLDMTLKGYTKGNTGTVIYKPGTKLSPPPTSTVRLYAKYNPAQLTSKPPDATKGTSKFLGWFSNPDGTGQQLWVGVKEFTSDATFYAVWESNLTYDPREGVNGTTGMKYEPVEVQRESGSVTLADGAELFPNCAYDFLGWTDVETGTVAKYQKGTKYTGSSSTLYAVWDMPPIIITFDYKGGKDTSGSYGPTKQEVPLGGSAKPPVVTKAGKTFSGWIGRYTNVQYSTTVYASWESSPIWYWTGSNWIPYFAGMTTE